MSDNRDPALDDALAGRIAESLAPEPPSAQIAARLRRRLLEAARQTTAAAAESHLTIPAAAGRWLKVLPGVSMKVLREDATTRSYLLRLAAGASLPPHAHAHDEECLVLEGDVWLDGLHAGAGDFHLAHRGRPHGEVRTEEGCLLFLRGEKHAIWALPLASIWGKAVSRFFAAKNKRPTSVRPD